MRRSPLAGLLLLVAVSASAKMQGQLNINSATAEELVGLPAIGPDRASTIVEYRRRHGRFTNLEQLEETPGIGPRTFEAIRPYLKLTGVSDFRGDDSPRQPVVARSSISPPRQGGAPVLLADGDYFPVLLRQIQGAKQRVDLAMFLFKSGDTPSNRPAQLVDALVAAQRRGVAVRVLLEREGRESGVTPNNNETAERLRKGGVKVLFDDPATTSHMKLVVIDARHCLLGSHNLTQAALAYNHELSLWMDDPRLAAELLGWFDRVAGER